MMAARRGWTRAGVLAATLALLAGCATVVPSSNPRVPVSDTSVLLRPGDSLTVSLQGIPDSSVNNVQIDEQGGISLPYIGNVRASGLTSAELSHRIRQAYVVGGYYTGIDVSVSVTERYIYVGGEVEHPGRIVWTPDLTLTKAIQAAGGFALYAREKQVSLVRDRNAYTIDAELALREPAQDPRLLPGDSIQVPRSRF